jgi:hypothetical protein
VGPAGWSDRSKALELGGAVAGAGGRAGGSERSSESDEDVARAAGRPGLERSIDGVEIGADGVELGPERSSASDDAGDGVDGVDGPEEDGAGAGVVWRLGREKSMPPPLGAAGAGEAPDVDRDARSGLE